MQKLSGLVLDVHDDQNGQVLKEVFPTQGDVPDLIKNAHLHTPEERAALPDDLFALVLTDGDVTLRKFACVDSGNTALSVEYFLKTAHKLPVEAQKVAAENLVTACGWYDIDPPEALRKIALGLGTALTAVTLPSTIKGTKRKIDQNMNVARASGSVVNPMVR